MAILSHLSKMRSKSVAPTQTQHGAPSSRNRRQRYSSNRPAKPHTHGPEAAVIKRGQSHYTSTFATLLEGPLLMPASASMFVEYPSHSQSFIHRLNKPLPALPERRPLSIYELSTEATPNEQSSEPSIAEMYEAYRPILRLPSPLPSQRRAGSSEGHNESSSKTKRTSRDSQMSTKRVPSWRPSLLRKRKPVPKRRDSNQAPEFSVRSQQRSSGHANPVPRGLSPLIYRGDKSAPVRPSPLRQSRNMTDIPTSNPDPSVPPGTASTSTQPLLRNPTVPMSNPPELEPPTCWTSLKSGMRRICMTEEAFLEWKEEGWQMHEGFHQLNPNFKTRSKGADRFGKMDFMIWSAKHK